MTQFFSRNFVVLFSSYHCETALIQSVL